MPDSWVDHQQVAEWADAVEVGIKAGIAVESEVELEFEAATGVEEPEGARSPAVAGIVGLLAADMGSIADNAVDKGHIQDTADSTADIVVAVDTTVLLLEQQPARQTGPEKLSSLAGWDFARALRMLSKFEPV